MCFQYHSVGGVGGLQFPLGICPTSHFLVRNCLKLITLAFILETYSILCHNMNLEEILFQTPGEFLT